MPRPELRQQGRQVVAHMAAGTEEQRHHVDARATGPRERVAGHLGLLRDWTPWMVAAAPSALYLMLSLTAFSWLVRYR